MLAVLLGALVATRALRADDPANALARARLVPFAPVPNAFLMEGAENFDHIRPLDRTTWLSAEDARFMRDDDLVFALHVEGQAWAMPWWVIKNHHAANLRIGDEPVLMTFCEACSGAAAYRARLASRRHTFRVVGLYNGSHFLEDRETGSYWLSFLGESFYGPLRGTRLERLPVQAATWAQWLDLHPASRVADGEHEPRDGHGARWAPGKAGITKRFEQTLVNPLDPRLAPNDLVIPVESGGHARAYPVAALERAGGIVNDTLGGEPIVVLHVPGTLLTSAFRRTLRGEVLSFERAADGSIVDREGGSTWSLSGEALTGPRRGQRLAVLPTSLEEWYGWAATHPGGQVFGAPPKTADMR